MNDVIEVAGYRLEHVLGKGGNGVVWHAYPSGGGVPVAVKFLKPRRSRRPHSFFHEAQALARLNHPGIVRILDLGITRNAPGRPATAGVPFIVMEHVSGESLQSRISSIAPRGLFEILHRLLDTLSYAHARGIVHRDIKPGNVLISGEDDAYSVKLVDFGLAFGLEEPHAESSSRVEGTPAYMAPEQIRGEHREIGPWTDLYAVGCIAWAAATGKAPFRAATTDETLLRHLRGEVDPFAPYMDLPAGFEEWIRNLIARSPYARFQRAVEARSALSQLEAPSGTWFVPRPAELEEELSGTATIVKDMVNSTLLSAASGHESWSQPELPVSRSVAIPADWRDVELSAENWTSGQALLRLFALREVELVGREQQRDQLWAALRDVVESREPAVAVLRGGYGRGKSRLARWLTERAHEASGAEILVARHGPREHPAAGLARIATRALRCEGLSGLPLTERVARQLERLGVRPDSLDFVTYVVVWLIESVGPSTRTSESEEAGPGPNEQIGAMVELVRAIARRRPTVLWLDDIHEAPTTARFVGRLLSTVDNVPILILTTVIELSDRPIPAHMNRLFENHPDKLISVPLYGLPDRDVASLVESLIDPDPGTLEQIVQRADGSPLFAVELVNDWAGSGALTAGADGRLVLSGSGSAVPEGLSEIWEARLDAALEASTADPEAGRRALELGAALGRRVRNAEWDLAKKRLGGLPVKNMLEELIRRELIVALPEGWRFRHQLLRNAIIDGAQASQRWAGHHAICADVLAEMYPPDMRGITARRAEHLMESHQYRQALDALWEAFREIRVFGEIERCEELLDEREKACDALDLSEEDPARVLNCLISSSVGRPYPDDRKWSGWLEETAEVSRANDYPELLAQALRGLANRKMKAGDCDAAVALYDASLEALDRVEDSEHSIDRMYALVQRGTALHRSGNADEALRSMGEASVIARELGPIYEARTAFEMMTVSLLDGRLDHARWLAEQAFEFLEGTHNQRIEGILVGRLGDVERAAGNFEKAREHYQRVKTLQETGVEVFGFNPDFKCSLLALAEGDTSALESPALRSVKSGPVSVALDLLSSDPEVVAAARESLASHPDGWLELDVDAQFIVRSGLLEE